ncbi:hypothetical protein LCGC14_1668680 [marine sediment metagenome]|uniref:Uncharacterized protein n=1 Tax=marine sediment metagenome TaxID=412755 RepID=A0A0F9K7V1_9ZZZZ
MPMVDENMEAVINSTGRNLGLHLPGFYGRVTLNYQNGVYVNSNVEQSIKPDAKKVQDAVRHFQGARTSQGETGQP